MFPEAIMIQYEPTPGELAHQGHQDISSGPLHPTQHSLDTDGWGDRQPQDTFPAILTL